MDFALTRRTPQPRPVVRTKMARMALIAGTCITTGVAFTIARDGEPPREGTRAEASPLVAPPGPAAIHAPRNSRADSPSDDPTNDAAPTIVELERLLAAGDRTLHPLVLEETLPAMVAQHPEDIARFAELETDPRLREELIRRVAQLWTRKDVNRAVAWVTSLPMSPERDASLIDMSLTLAETDPEQALNLREPAVGNIEPDGVLEAIVQRWAERDFDAALAWINARPASVQHDKLLQRLVFVRAAAGAPREAARMVDESFGSGPQKAEAADIVVGQWSQTDPAAASDWRAGLE
jgi:hypothetical protein